MLILRNGRGLPTTGAPCGLEFLAQALTLPAEPLTPRWSASRSRSARSARSRGISISLRGSNRGAMDPARRGYARSLKNVQVRNSGSPAYCGLLEWPEPANQRRRNILAGQAYSETADWPLRALSRAVVCGSVLMSSKKPSSLS